MAEKRKLPPRAGREPAAKRRVSEAVTPSQKKKAATPRVPTPPLEPVEAPLPVKMKDGEPLPVLRARQPDTLSEKEYQSMAESAVLLASLERSKKKWLSDGILVRYYTKPKKTKREQIEKNNPPKDSMSRIGPCDITVGPHLFGAMLYIVKDPTVPPPIQYATPQRPMVHYGHPNNFQPYQPYPSPSNGQKRPAYPPGPPGRPPQGYPGNGPNNQQRGPRQTHPAPSPSGQRPPGQNAPPGQPAKQNPDPVIQMLATRAAADPELKALMRVVASSQATQEQLRAFQAHIDELNAIIKSREQQEQRQQNSTGTSSQSTPQPATPAPQNKPHPPQPSSQQKQAPEQQAPPKEQNGKKEPTAQAETPSKETPKQPASSEPQPSGPAKSQSEGTQPGTQPQTPAPPQESQPPKAPAQPIVKQEPAATGSSTPQPAPVSSTQPSTSTPAANPASASTPASNIASQQQSPAVRPPQLPTNAQQPAPRPGPPYPPYQQAPNGAQAPIQSRPPQYNSPGSYYRPPAPPARPAPLGYKSVVFEFTSPLTPYGSSTSGHAGSGDRYLFPEYSILEWLPNESTILASFLVVRKVDPNAPFPIESPQDPATARGKGKGASKSKKGKVEKGKGGSEMPAPNLTVPPTSTETPMKSEPSDKPGVNPVPEGLPSAPASTPAESFTAEPKLKEYWQPVTFRIHAPQAKSLEPLTRVVKPAEEVRKYMNEIMDRAERAPDGFPAFRLPREEAREVFESEGTPASATNAAAASRARTLRAGGKAAEEDSEVENTLPDFEEEEEELKDFYGDPMGLPPLRA